ncbi:MAG: glycosyl transferase [Crocinitomix sp. MedPE-SWsnd]|nr:MAG: glycosyl transferase [Crocinitomix sp. MedPE-SWsnd]
MYLLVKRIADIISSFCVLILLFPFFLIIAIWILLDSKGGIFYTQTRVGKNKKEFQILKFRSMAVNSDKKGAITVGQDARVTRSGRFIRKYKIDEFPQLLNVILGQMSVVGPRPEVPKYVNLYTEDQLKVLSIRPGLTDYASLEYFEEQKMLGESSDPEKTYIESVMPAKLSLNLKYVEEQGLLVDLKCIFKTIGKIFK